MKLWQRWCQVSLPNKALVGAGVLTAFGTLFYAGAAAYQVHLMRVTSADSAAQVERLTKATNDAIEASTKSSSEALNKALADNRTAVDKAISQAKASSDTSAMQAKQVLDSTVEAMRNDQRAWLSIIGIHIPKEPEAGASLVVNFSVVNSGKTPALKVLIKNGIFLWPSPDEP